MLNNRMIALFDLRCYRKNGDDQYCDSIGETVPS